MHRGKSYHYTSSDRAEVERWLIETRRKLAGAFTNHGNKIMKDLIGGYALLAVVVLQILFSIAIPVLLLVALIKFIFA